MSEDGETQGHYICDLEDKQTLVWFRTNDNQEPIPISLDNVTKNAVVILYRKICSWIKCKVHVKPNSWVLFINDYLLK